MDSIVTISLWEYHSSVKGGLYVTLLCAHPSLLSPDRKLSDSPSSCHPSAVTGGLPFPFFPISTELVIVAAFLPGSHMDKALPLTSSSRRMLERAWVGDGFLCWNG